MERTRLIEHNGVQIVLLDYSGLRDIEEGLREIAKTRAFVAGLPKNGSHLTLTDATDTAYDKRILDAMKDLTTHNKPYVKAAAVVSHSAVHRAAVSMVALFSRRNLSTFDTRAEALAWLVGQR